MKLPRQNIIIKTAEILSYMYRYIYIDMLIYGYISVVYKSDQQRDASHKAASSK